MRIFILFALFYLSFFFNLGDVPLFNLDEGAFSEAVREMLKSGDFITTYLGGELRFDKPILIYWLEALSVKIFGINEFAFRLPSALSAFLWGWAIYFFVKEEFDEQKAFWSALFFASAIQISIIAKAAIADSLLNLFIALSMFFVWRYFQKRVKRDLYFVFLFIGLGTLTKGPVAIMIPFVVSFLFLLYKKDFRFWLKSVFDIKGILIFLLVAAPWYVAEYMAQGEAFIDGFFLKHNLQRFNSAFESHSGGYFYYVPVLLIGLLPFTALILKGLWGLKRRDLDIFLLFWFLFVFIFFSFSGTKLPHYVIYGYTPLFIFGSFVVCKFKKISYVILPMVFLFSIFMFVREIALIFVDKIKDLYAKELIFSSADIFGIDYKLKLFFIIAVLLGMFFVKNVRKALVSVAFISLLGLNGVVIPSYAKLVEEPIKEAGLFIAEKDLKNVVMYGMNTPSVMVYAKRIIKRDMPKSGDIVFTKINKLNDFKNYKILFKKRAVAVAKIL
ncbi:MAG: glycosyltransferase family 39 protein [Epsilonproteobacteria bacterium]|nr:glycosyltransferase family 39 protein [Campylobacterota bacterium]